MTTEPGRLRLEKSDGVALLTLSRPDKRNVLDDRLLVEELPAAYAEVRDDPSISVLVVTGDPPAFCGGADLNGCTGFRRADVADAEDFTRATLEGVVDLYELPQLTIAAVNGVAVGAGFGTALACDLRIAGPTARFMSPFIRMALVPDYGLSWLLPRIVSAADALDIMMTGRFVEADEALAMGLVWKVVEDPLAFSMEYATRLAAGPRRALRVTKLAVRKAFDIDMATAVLVHEARSQAVATHGPEFRAAFAAWRAEVFGPDDVVPPPVS
ncbi:MAG: enoyl-CoA hydratase/isomerase family protein [Acidimicrobiia bacterium]